MKIAIRYYTKTNNTKKLAEAIGECLHVEPKDVKEPINEKVDVLFLGSSVYAAGIDNEVKKFISNLDSTKVGKVVNFSTAAVLPSTYKQVKELVEAKGIKMAEEEFHCRGRFTMMHRDRPNSEDLNNVKQFAMKIVK